MLCEYFSGLAKESRAGWERFWFTPVDPLPTAAIRIIVALVLLYTHLATLSDLLAYLGPHAWVDPHAVEALRHLPADPGHPGLRFVTSGAQSIWFYVSQPWLIWTLHALFLAATVCLALGFCTRAATVVAWIGHLSYIQRGIVLVYGLDSIVAMLLLYLMFAPSGAEWSLDRRLRKTAPKPFPHGSTAANVVLRLIQLHVCMIYLASGLSKLQGATWWNGTAAYTALMPPEVAAMDLTWLGRSETVALAVSNACVLFTFFVELGFPILVWNRRLRPLMLLCAWSFQLGLGLLMHLGSFQAAMFAATLAFVSPATFRRISDRGV